MTALGRGEIGQRVKLVAPSPRLTLRSPLGVIVRREKYGGYVAVRLDQAATYRCGDGPAEARMVVVEHPDHLESA